MLVNRARRAVGAREDARLLEGVFEFTEKTAEEVMTPRTDIEALEAELDMRGAADRVAEALRARYPVYTGGLDEIVGVVHAKDILSALRASPEAPIRSIMRAPLFVPGTREVEDVLADMKRLKVHLAVVLDEYGGTAGLVTMEDCWRRSSARSAPRARRSTVPLREAAGAPVLDGSMTIGEFNEAHAASLDDTHYTTLGGFLFGQLGRLPRVGDRVTGGERAFEIVEMEGRRVKSVRLV
jgi:putative hemolysin